MVLLPSQSNLVLRRGKGWRIVGEPPSRGILANGICAFQTLSLIWAAVRLSLNMVDHLDDCCTMQIVSKQYKYRFEIRSLKYLLGRVRPIHKNIWPIISVIITHPNNNCWLG